MSAASITIGHPLHLLSLELLGMWYHISASMNILVMTNKAILKHKKSLFN